jgi:hypothetical protein
VLPRFPDEADALPQFSLESTQERAPLRIADADKTLQQLAADDLELIDEEPSAPPSIMPVALDASDLEDDLEEEAIEDLPRRKLPWRPFAIGAAAVAAVGILFLASSSSGAGGQSTVAAALTALPKLTVELPTPPVVPPPAPAIVEPPPAPQPPTTGTLVAPQWTKGRRVWIDGKPIAGHAPKLEAACGKHTVRVGAYGKTRKVDIVCGGETKVTP